MFDMCTRMLTDIVDNYSVLNQIADYIEANPLCPFAYLMSFVSKRSIHFSAHLHLRFSTHLYMYNSDFQCNREY